MFVDVAFRLLGTDPLPADHGYALYSAVSRFLPAVHSENGVAIHPVCGRQIGNRRLLLTPSSTLSLRVPAEQISGLLGLAGKSLRIVDATIHVGIPEVRPLAPAASLRSRLVVIKVANINAQSLTADSFASAVQRQLNELGVAATAEFTVGKRRSLTVHHKEIVGYEVFVAGLTSEESVTLQSKGLGGKRHMGCGLFVPIWERD